MPINLDRLIWETHDRVPDDSGRVVDDGIGMFNEEAAATHQVQKLSSFARRADGTVLGGAIGRTWGQCCELQLLWVDQPYRHKGIGSQLMALFHARAESRGCRTFYLDTFSFQAPDFYRALGYEVHARITGFAAGIVKYTMLRQFAPER